MDGVMVFNRWRQSAPTPSNAFLGLSESSTLTASGLVQLFCTAHIERGPTEVLNPNGISIGSAIFAGLTTVTDRQTDRHC